MASLKLLVTLILTLAFGATGVATVSTPGGATGSLDTAMSRVRTTLGLATQVQVGTRLSAQNGQVSVGAGANGRSNTQMTVSTQKKKENAQITSSTTVNANSNARMNTSTNSTTNTKTDVSGNAAVNSNAASEQDDGSLKVATAIANEFSVAVKDVTALHDKGWGYGEIEKLYEMARESGASVSLIEPMRTGGKG
jgi:hypothetical protein